MAEGTRGLDPAAIVYHDVPRPYRFAVFYVTPVLVAATLVSAVFGGRQAAEFQYWYDLLALGAAVAMVLTLCRCRSLSLRLLAVSFTVAALAGRTTIYLTELVVGGFSWSSVLPLLSSLWMAFTIILWAFVADFIVINTPREGT